MLLNIKGIWMKEQSERGITDYTNQQYFQHFFHKRYQVYSLYSIQDQSFKYLPVQTLFLYIFSFYTTFIHQKQRLAVTVSDYIRYLNTMTPELIKLFIKTQHNTNKIPTFSLGNPVMVNLSAGLILSVREGNAACWHSPALLRCLITGLSQTLQGYSTGSPKIFSYILDNIVYLFSFLINVCMVLTRGLYPGFH